MGEAREIAIKIETSEEHKKLKDFVEDFDDEYYNIFMSTDFNPNFLPYIFYFCVNKENRGQVPGLVTSHNIQYNRRDIEKLINNIENTDQFNGVYKELLTMDDFEHFKKILEEGRIIPKRPTYNPRKFVRENKIVNTFNDYLLDRMFEDKKELSVPFIISQRLEGLLSNINHPIAKRLIEESSNGVTQSTKATLVDYDEDADDKFTYTLPTKFVDALDDILDIEFSTADKGALYDVMKLNKRLYDVFRTSIKIGRLINKIYPDEYKPNGKDSIEEFVNAVKLERNRKFDNFEIVKGNDIIKYYNQNSYTEDAFNGSELGNSCMKYNECTDYIYFYSINEDVSLLVLKSQQEDEEDKIVARALLWNLSECNNKGVTGKFMDRIYFTRQYEKELFIEYAQENKWFYKKIQSDASNKIWNPNKEEFEECLLKTKDTFKQNPTNEYPYMDTMKWFYVDRGFLANTPKFKEDDEEVFFMEETGGGYHIERPGKYIEYYDDYISEDELVWCEYGDDYRIREDAIWLEYEDQYATDDFARTNCAVTYDGKWILNDDAVYFVDNQGREDIAFREDAENNFYFSEVDDTWYEDAYKSDHYGSFIGKPKAIKVYTTDNIKDIMKDVDNVKSIDDYDYYVKDDGNYFFYYYGMDAIPISKKFKNNFVSVRTSLSNPDSKIYLHKKYDNGSFGKVGNEYYTIDLVDMAKKRSKKGK
jgi:hypothetical protein